MTRHRTLLTGVLTGSLILGLGLTVPAIAQSVDDRPPAEEGQKRDVVAI